MKKDLKKIIFRIFILSIPFIIWVISLLVIDPFNYFNLNNYIKNTSKEKTARKFNSLLYNTIAFKNNPSANIIIGDSRIKRLPTEEIKQITGDNYFILHSNAAKLNEIIDLFWLTTKYKKLENVVLGVNFNLYNEFAYANRVYEVEEMIKNPLLYVFNGNVLEITIKTLVHHFSNIVVPDVKRNIMLQRELEGKSFKDKKAWWKYNVNTVAKNQYSKYEYPKELRNRLIELNNYCIKEKINLIFLNVPHHIDFSNRKIDFQLSEAEIRYKKEMSNFKKFIDFDYPNSITNCRNCFTDPIHTNDSINFIIAKEIFNDSLVIGKNYKNQPLK